MAQAILHHRQHLRVAAAFGIEDAVRRQSGPGKSGGKKIASGERPQHLSLFLHPRKTRGERGEEQGRRGIVAGFGARGRRLVQRRPCEPAARQPCIDLIDSERQHAASGRPASLLDRFDLGAQRSEARIFGRVDLHATRTHLFALCSASCTTESSKASLPPA